MQLQVVVQLQEQELAVVQAVLLQVVVHLLEQEVAAAKAVPVVLLQLLKMMG